MERLNRRLAGAATLSAVTLMGAACSATGAADGELVIGMVNDTSGSASAYSPYTTKGIELAIEEINEAGGIQGKTVRLESLSDGSDTSQTATLVRKLGSKGASVMILNSGSASAVAANAACDSMPIVCLSPATPSSAIVSADDAGHTYILGPSSGSYGAVYGQAMPEAGIQRLAIVADDSSTIQPYVPVLAEPIEEAGIEIVTIEKIPVGASDVTAQIERVKDSDPDGVFVVSSGGQTEALVHGTLHQQLPDVQRFSLSSVGDQPTLWDIAAPGSLEGLVYISSIDPENPRTQKVAEGLERLGGKHSELTGYALRGYDAMYLLKEAMEKADSTEVDKIQQGLHEIAGYQPHYGAADFAMSYTADKHVAADGDCGIVLGTFGADNRPGKAWPVYQPSC